MTLVQVRDLLNEIAGWCDDVASGEVHFERMTDAIEHRLQPAADAVNRRIALDAAMRDAHVRYGGTLARLADEERADAVSRAIGEQQ